MKNYGFGTLGVSASLVVALVLIGCSAATPKKTTVEAPEVLKDTVPSFAGAEVTNRTYPLSSVTCRLVLPEATGGNGGLSYSLTPTVPDWTFDPANRLLSISLTTDGMWDMLYRVEDSDENTEDSDADDLRFTITVTVPSDIEMPEEGLVSTYKGCGNEVFSLNPDGGPLDSELYTLVLAAASADVYLIATNTTIDDIAPTIEPLDLSTSPPATMTPTIDPAVVARHFDTDDAWHSHHPSITEFNNSPPRPTDISPSVSELRPSTSEGDTFTFWDLYGSSEPRQVPAIARRVVTDGTTSAVFWVEDDDSWGTCQYCVTYEMIDALANDFLASGIDNDIHDWVTAIFGAHWGPHTHSGLILQNIQMRFMF